VESFAKEVEALLREPDPNPAGALQAQMSLPLSRDETKENPPKRRKNSAK
jgi:hypothetical protein